jgi:aldose 1-epimerase
MEQKKLFGTTSGGEQVWQVSLENKKGLSADIITLGGIIRTLCVPGQDGKTVDVILGYDSLEGLNKNPSWTAAVIGRVANRISNASFEINGRIIKVETLRNMPYCLHSGPGCYGFQQFSIVALKDNSVTLYYRDDGKAGFPGNVDVWVTYTLTDDNSLVLEYRALPDEDTPVSLTNHAYFNLSGHDSPGLVYDHDARILADFYTDVDKDGIPTGQILKVEGTPLDLTKPANLGQGIKALADKGCPFGGYDYNYVLRGNGYRLVSTVVSNTTNIKMETFTDLPGAQLYSANMLKEGTGKGGALYKVHQAFCMETQLFQNAINVPWFRSPVVKAGQLMTTRSAYKFSLKERDV